MPNTVLFTALLAETKRRVPQGVRLPVSTMPKTRKKPKSPAEPTNLTPKSSLGVRVR